MTSPATGCSTTASIRAVQVSGLRRQADGCANDPVGLALGRAQLGNRERLPEVLLRRSRWLQHDFVGLAQQLGDAALAHRNRRHHGNAQHLRHARGIDGHAAPGRDIEHVEHQHQRPAGLLEFEQQPDRQPQIGGIRHTQDEIGRSFAGSPAQDEIPGDFLVRAAAAQRVGAGQINHRSLPAERGDKKPFLALDGDAGIIRDLLPAARQRIE